MFADAIILKTLQKNICNKNKKKWQNLLKSKHLKLSSKVFKMGNRRSQSLNFKSKRDLNRKT